MSSRPWRTLGFGVAAAVLLLAGAAGTTLADAGPHVASINSGATGINADTCAGCHRAHTAQGLDLLAAGDDTALCLVCHGSASAGATTNVIDGILAASAPIRALKGGGFVNVTMDSSWTATTGAPAASRPATSWHAYEASVTGTMWGNGAIGSCPGKSGVALVCIDCHNPHGSGTYRILRPIPTGSDASTGVQVTDQATKVYTVSSSVNRYFGEVYDITGVYDWTWYYQLDSWCGQCHTRYPTADSGTGHTPSGDPIFAYRHMTEYQWDIDCAACHPGTPGNMSAQNWFGIDYRTAHESPCQNCHVAHGSSASMGTYSGAVAWPNGATAPNGDERSSLLRLDNRGVCVGCHGSPGLR